MLPFDAVVDDFAQAVFVPVEPIGVPAGSPAREATGVPSGRTMGFGASRQAVRKANDFLGRTDVAETENVYGFLPRGTDLGERIGGVFREKRPHLESAQEFPIEIGALAGEPRRRGWRIDRIPKQSAGVVKTAGARGIRDGPNKRFECANPAENRVGNIENRWPLLKVVTAKKGCFLSEAILIRLMRSDTQQQLDAASGLADFRSGSDEGIRVHVIVDLIYVS